MDLNILKIENTWANDTPSLAKAAVSWCMQYFTMRSPLSQGKCASHRGGLKKLAITLLLLLPVCISSAYATIIEVGKSSRFSSIAAALNHAQAFDTLLIHPGLYREDSVLIKKPLTLKGIDFPKVENRHNEGTIIIGADHVVIEGLQIQHVKHSYVSDLSGIRLVEAKHCTIRNNRLINTFFGIYLQNSRSCTIENNVVKGQAIQEMSSGNAIHLWYCKDILIQNNKVIKHRDGIYLEFVENSQVIGNESIDNIRYGMHFMFSHHTSYYNNIFRNNGTGVAVMFSDHIVMEENHFMDNWGPASYGILLKDIKDSQIKNNVFENNTTAIYMDNSLRIHFQYNALRKNGRGIKLLGSCNENMFTQNAFTGNNFDISTDSKTSDNSFKSNYWDKYKGYDLDDNNIGDVAYNPVTLSSYIVSNYPASIILLRTLFLDVLDMVEKTTPVFVPTDLIDPSPLMEEPTSIQNQNRIAER